MSLLQASLSLPGIAGSRVHLGMAVDANVLIYERIREELRIGNSPQSAINAGFDKAFSTIADSNVTTLIAGVVLFAFGTGPIKSFAVRLTLGILTSLFTSVVGSRALVHAHLGPSPRAWRPARLDASRAGTAPWNSSTKSRRTRSCTRAACAYGDLQRR